MKKAFTHIALLCLLLPALVCAAPLAGRIIHLYNDLEGGGLPPNAAAGRSAGGPVVTWDAENKSANIILSNGDLSATCDTSFIFTTAKATLSRSEGKWYFEVTHNDIDGGSYNVTAGVQNASESNEVYVGDTVDGWGYQSNGRFWNSSMNGTHATWQATGETIAMFAVDLDNGKIWFGVEGVWSGSGSPDPATGTDPAFSNLSGQTVFPACTPYVSPSTLTGHFSAADQTYSAPSGFSPWQQ